MLATNPPLAPNASQEAGGNLTAIATATTTTAAAQGTPVTAATQLTGGAGALGWLSGIFTKLSNPLAVTGAFYQTTQPVSAATLPLPAGAAIETGNLAAIAASNSTVTAVTGTVADAAYAGSGNSTTIGGLKGIYAAIKGTLAIRALTSADVVTANAGTNLNTSALAVETGGNLASLNTKLPSQGQALAGASLPVVLTAAQMTTLTPLSTVAITATSLPLPAGAATAANQPALVSGRTPVDGSGVTQPVSGAFWQSTQPVSITALPALTAGAAVIGSISNTSFIATQATAANLNATVVGVVTSNAGTNLNTSALAVETGGNLAAINTATGAVADAAYSGTGNGTINGILKGVLAAIKGVLIHDDVQLASIIDSTTTAGYVYFPEAAVGTAVATAAWRISRLNTTTGQTQWINGNANYSNTAVAGTYSAASYS